MCSGLFFTIGKKKVQSSRQLLLERRACFTARWEWRRWRKAGKQNLSIWWASRMFWAQLHTSHWNSPTGIISTQNHSVHCHSQDQALQDKGLLTTYKHPPRKKKNKYKKKKNRSKHLRRFLLCALNNFPLKCGSLFSSGTQCGLSSSHTYIEYCGKLTRNYFSLVLCYIHKYSWVLGQKERL